MENELKQKQIEEMARDICNICRDMYGVCDNNEELCPAIKEEMEYLSNAGYRKIPEGAVVLTREEQETHIIMTKINYESIMRQLKQERKETAEKLLDKVDYESNGQTKAITDLLRKEYGVELNNEK